MTYFRDFAVGTQVMVIESRLLGFVREVRHRADKDTDYMVESISGRRYYKAVELVKFPLEERIIREIKEDESID